MSSFSLLDVFLIIEAWLCVALAFDQISIAGRISAAATTATTTTTATSTTSCALSSPIDLHRLSYVSSSSSSSSSTKSAVVVVILIATLGCLLSIPSFILFQYHIKEALDWENGEIHYDEDDDVNQSGYHLGNRHSSHVGTSFDHRHLLESEYQVWSKLILRYWLPLILISGAVAIGVILLKKRRCVYHVTSLSTDVITSGGFESTTSADELARRSAASSNDEPNADHCFHPSQPLQQNAQQQPLLPASPQLPLSPSTSSPAPHHDDDALSGLKLTTGFARTCVAKLLVYLLFALPHFVLTNILYLDKGHLDAFHVLRATAVASWRAGGGGGEGVATTASMAELSTAQTVVSLTSILVALQSVASFFVFVCGSRFVRLRFQGACNLWCHGTGKS